MSEMIERVARAMLAADYPDDVGGELEYLWWDRHGETYLRYARAAIEAMRAPTEAMRDGQARAISESQYGALRYEVPDEEIQRVYYAMIDAALS